MQNPSSTEDTFVRALRDVETKRPPQDIVARLAATRSARPSSVRWGLPVVAAAASVWFLAATLALHPGPTYASVLQTFQAQTKYTITESIGIDDKLRVPLRRYRDGNCWRSGVTLGLEDRTITFAGAYATIDAPLSPPQEEFQPERLLWQDANPTVERGSTWNGRKVDIFREGPDNELVVDPETMLPIQLTEVREGVTDVWTFDFTAPPADVFKLDLPQGIPVYDLRQQRRQIAEKLAANPTGQAIFDESGTLVLLTPSVGDYDKFAPAVLEANGSTHSGIAHPILENRLHPSSPFRTVTINGREWTVSILKDAHLSAPTLTGTIQIGPTTQSLKGVTLLKTGSALDLVLSFTN